jgi:putative transposase
MEVYLENMRCRSAICIYGYVIMPEHVHLLINEPEPATIADAMHFLKLSFAKRLRSPSGAVESGSFWQKPYYDRIVRDAREFTVKLRYLHRNPANVPPPRLASKVRTRTWGTRPMPQA